MKATMQNSRLNPRTAGAMPRAEGLYGPALRARLVRRRFRREHQGRAVARARPAGVRSLRESAAPRRVRLRGEHGRRRRDAPAASAPVLPQGGSCRRVRVAGAGRLRRRHGVPAARRRRTAAGGGDVRPHRPRRGPAPARLARRADGQRTPRRHREEWRAGHPPDLHWARAGSGRRGGRGRRGSNGSCTSSAAARRTRPTGSSFSSAISSTSPACRRTPSSTRGC